jgi:hypothetical protein
MERVKTIEEAQTILNCIDCQNHPTHPLDKRNCSEFSDTQVIDAAANKGKCRKQPRQPKQNKYPAVQ